MADLFVKSDPEESLAAFSLRMAALFTLPEIERRESLNYYGGDYFLGTALSVETTFALTDDADVSDYRFWIHLKPTGAWVDDQSFLDGLADLLARRLTIAGEVVVRMIDAWSKDRARKIVYKYNVGVERFASDEVTTTEG